MSEFIGICAFAAICSSLVLMISKSEKELATLISAALYIIIMIFVITRTGTILEAVKAHFNHVLNIQHFKQLIKCAGIAILSTVASSICNEIGQKGISSAIDVFAVIEILYITTPLIFELFTKLTSLIGK